MTSKSKTPKDKTADPAADHDAAAPACQPAAKPAKEIGGRDGLDPTRYGDWEKGGRAIDF